MDIDENPPSAQTNSQQAYASFGGSFTPQKKSVTFGVYPRNPKRVAASPPSSSSFTTLGARPDNSTPTRYPTSQGTVPFGAPAHEPALDAQTKKVLDTTFSNITHLLQLGVYNATAVTSGTPQFVASPTLQWLDDVYYGVVPQGMPIQSGVVVGCTSDPLLIQVLAMMPYLHKTNADFLLSWQQKAAPGIDLKSVAGHPTFQRMMNDWNA